MPVLHKKKDNTTRPSSSTEGQSAPALPDHQEIHQHLRTLAQSFVRVVLETVMREELDVFIVAGYENVRQEF